LRKLSTRAQGIHCQETIPGRGGEVTSYLNLLYVADGVGLPEAATAFKRRVDEIRAVHYAPAMARELVELARDQGNPEIREVIDGLRSRYLE
jgi:hypothetical protein